MATASVHGAVKEMQPSHEVHTSEDEDEEEAEGGGEGWIGLDGGGWVHTGSAREWRLQFQSMSCSVCPVLPDLRLKSVYFTLILMGNIRPKAVYLTTLRVPHAMSCRGRRRIVV